MWLGTQAQKFGEKYYLHLQGTTFLIPPFSRVTAALRDLRLSQGFADYRSMLGSYAASIDKNTYRRFERSYYLPRPVVLLWLLLGITILRSVVNCQLSSCKGRFTLSVKLSDLTVWRHTWRKNWVNCAVLTGNSAGLGTVLSSRLSHTELRSSLRDSHSFLSLPVFIHHNHTPKTQRTDKKTYKTKVETCFVPENIQFCFSCSFLHR